MNRRRPLKVAKIIVFVAVLFAALGWVVMTLWNALLPPLFGWHAIAFHQALGLLLLSRILFGGLRGPGFGLGGHIWGERWRHHVQERWAQMTPEQREKFRAGLRGRCWGNEPPERPVD